MEVRVRHGLARWREARPKDRSGGVGYVVRTAFRNQVVDIPDDEARRLMADEIDPAVIPANEELARGGRLSDIPTGAGAEELAAWVSVATEADITRAIVDHPDMEDRIRDARAKYQQAVAEQSAHLGGLPGPGSPPTIPLGELATETVVPEGDGAEGTGAGEGDDADPDAGDEDYTDSDYDEIVSGNVAEVQEFLKEYPVDFQRVLDAESRRAAAANEQPRKGVVEAARIAAEHSTGA